MAVKNFDLLTKTLNKSWIIPLGHLTCWILFYLVICELYPVFDLGINTDGKQVFISTHKYNHLVLMAVCLLFFYLHSFVLFPKFFLNKRAYYFIGLSIISTALPFLQYQVDAALIDHYDKFPTGNKVDIGYLFVEGIGLNVTGLVYFITFVFSLWYSFYLSWFKDQKLKQLIIRDKVQAENDALRAQVNPHFLFNTLNTFFSLAQKHNASEIEEGVATLSDMFRYTLENQNGKAPLEKEIEYISAYIYLQNLRFKDDSSLNIRFDVQGVPGNLTIHQMILINFIENAFKHGVGNTAEAFVHVSLKLGLVLELEVINSKGSGESIDSFGFGLSNVRSRLELLYPEKHELLILSQEKTFKIILKLELDENDVHNS